MRPLISFLIALLLASVAAGTAFCQTPGADPPRPGGAPPLGVSAGPSAVERLASALDVGGMHVVLQSTTLQEVQARLGGSISRQGDSGVGVRSLCYYPPSSRSPWALWIQSSELYQKDVIHGFRLARLAAGSPPEAGCTALRSGGGEAMLAGMLRLGEPRDAVVATFGPPVTETVTGTAGTLLFLRAGLTVIEDTLFTVQNRAFMKLEAGRVDSIEIWKSTSIAQ